MVKLEDFTKELNIADGAKAIAFDCINTISDIYGDEPIIANAMIKGVRYYLGYLVQAGAFEEIDKENVEEEKTNKKTPKFKEGQRFNIDYTEQINSHMTAHRIRGDFEILNTGEGKNRDVYYKIQQNIDGKPTGNIVFVKEDVLERSEILR